MDKQIRAFEEKIATIKVEGKHTPGPWRAEGQVRYPERIASYIIGAPEGHGPIAEVYQYPNARLIAAAPELLEAAEAMCQDGKSPADIDRAYAMLRSAIAKAKGE